MILMDLKLDNIYSFRDFHINFSYPKKIVNSTIKNEFLPNKTNFRYKKVNIILGTNASGKTILGEAIINIFKFITFKNIKDIYEIIDLKNKKAFFSIDFLVDEDILYRLECKFEPSNDRPINSSNIKIKIYKSEIKNNDSYETCSMRFKEISIESDEENLNYVSMLELLPNINCYYSRVEENNFVYDEKIIDKKLEFLNIILKTLDSSIKEVIKSKEADDTLIIKFKNNKDVIVQNGALIDNGMLSSGTKSGISLADMVFNMYVYKDSLYYCDEKFAYIHSDIEKKIMNIMISMLGNLNQLFITTHNLEILDMNLPKHSFIFMKKKENIECVFADKYMKKNNVSIKNSYDNDLFNVAPSLEEFDRLIEELEINE